MAEDTKVESVIGQVVTELFVQAEASYRRSRKWEHTHRVEWKDRRTEEIRLAAEKAERERREEEERLRQERVSHLLQLSEDHRKAETIRTLIASVESIRNTEASFAAWRKWALNVAAEIDPIGAIKFHL